MAPDRAPLDACFSSNSGASGVASCVSLSGPKGTVRSAANAPVDAVAMIEKQHSRPSVLLPERKEQSATPTAAMLLHGKRNRTRARDSARAMSRVRDDTSDTGGPS